MVQHLCIASDFLPIVGASDALRQAFQRSEESARLELDAPIDLSHVKSRVVVDIVRSPVANDQALKDSRHSLHVTVSMSGRPSAETENRSSRDQAQRKTRRNRRKASV